MLSIVVPYLSNSQCIDLFKQLIKENTSADYELVEIVDNTDVYEAWNEGVRRSTRDVVILINDDMFIPKNWDIPYVKYAKGKTLVTGYVVEPGVIPVSDLNICKDFGKNPNTYRKDDFQKWSEEMNKCTPEVINGKGWYMPMAIERKYFIEYPNEIKYPHPNDVILIDQIMPSMGYNFLKVNSYCYHLQAFTYVKNVDRN